MLQGMLGLAAIVTVAWLAGEDRRRVSLRTVAAGLALQFGLALLLLRVPFMRSALLGLNGLVLALDKATQAGTSFVFGYLGGAELPFAVSGPGSTFVFAMRSLPIILVMSALSALLFYWRIIPLIVRGFSLLMQRTMGLGGALGVGVSVNVFVGMIEAPVCIRPYLGQLTRSELFTLMTAGMATIAGTMLVLYAQILGPVIPGALGQILVASIISVPAAVLVSRLMVPETGGLTDGHVVPPQVAASSMDAVAQGTTQGVGLFINVAAMLVVFVALVALANVLLGLLPDVAGAPLTLERMFGWVLSPVAWLIGLPWSEAQTGGTLLGEKVVLNEFIAYLHLAAVPAAELSERSRVILTYALCGFANFGSLGIMIGGLSAMAPERGREIVGLGLRSVLAGLLATCMTGAVVGMLY
ncbi:MAG: NupC/NupG family nucleoside CNT transporter [Desulfovibrionaceae bacterium]